MFAFIITVHILVSIFLIFVILLQPGKGEGMGGAFGGGGGGSATVFGGRGSVTFLAKITEGCAVIFMITSLTLAYRSSHSDSVLRARRNLAAQDAGKKTETKKVPLPTGQTAPAPATGGAVVPVPGNLVPAPGQPASSTPQTSAPAKARTAPAPRPQAAPADPKGK